MAELEHRAFVEVRALGRRLRGLAAPFDQVTHIAGFDEVIRRGAFSESLRENADILALVDHDEGKLLGRTKTGTLRLEESRQGLLFEIDMPETSLGSDVLALARRGDLGGMSFSFRVRPAGERWDKNLRELRSVDLVEISAIHSFPAYPNTQVHARSRQHHPRLHLAERFLETV